MKIFITGYGIFRGYNRNPSAEAVKILQKKLQNSEQNFPDVEFVIKPELKVTYSEIDELVYPDNCDIVINVGVSHKARTVLTLETQACGKSYCRADVENVIKHDSKCTLEEEKNDTKFTRINVDYVISKLKCSSVKSTDAGRYLCEYVFYKSLGHQAKSLFVHVCEENIHSVEETADGLFELIEILVNSYKC